MTTTSCVNNLPVELLARVFSLLELHQLLAAAQTCRLWRAVCSDPLLNPFRDPIVHILENQYQEDSDKAGGMHHLRTLSAFQWIPSRTWFEILAMASPYFILFEWVVPNLSEEQWEEAFRLRFPPSWTKWRRDGRWRAAFLKSVYWSVSMTSLIALLRMLMRIWHRLNATCTSDEAWTSYLIINRNDNVNLGTGSSRTFNPHAMFNALKCA
jgi:F-box-like